MISTKLLLAEIQPNWEDKQLIASFIDEVPYAPNTIDEWVPIVADHKKWIETAAKVIGKYVTAQLTYSLEIVAMIKQIDLAGDKVLQL